MVERDIGPPRDDDPPAVAKARQLVVKARQLSQGGHSKKACRYSYEAARRFLSERSCSSLVGAAAAAVQLIEDTDADAAASQPNAIHSVFGNLPDLPCGRSVRAKSPVTVPVHRPVDDQVCLCLTAFQLAG